MSKDLVILIPGIYMPSLSMGFLAYCLRQQGFQTKLYGSRHLRCTVKQNAASLYQQIEQLSVPNIHFVGHSLGGLLIRHLMASYSEHLPPGRCVTLGTPHTGSIVAQSMAQHHLGSLLGRSKEQALLGNIPSWPKQRDLGSLAGQAKLGIGQLLAKLPVPHDGTVAFTETYCENMRDQIMLPLNHTTMLFDRRVAQQATYFLRHGCFDHTSSAKMRSL